jgi:hypothetical protein
VIGSIGAAAMGTAIGTPAVGTALIEGAIETGVGSVICLISQNQPKTMGLITIHK